MTFSVLFTFTDFQLIYVLTRGGPLNATHLMATLVVPARDPGRRARRRRGDRDRDGPVPAGGDHVQLLRPAAARLAARRQGLADAMSEDHRRSNPSGMDYLRVAAAQGWSRSTCRCACSCSCCCSRSTGWPSPPSSRTTNCCRARATRSGSSTPTLAHFNKLLFDTAYPEWMWNTVLVVGGRHLRSRWPPACSRPTRSSGCASRARKQVGLAIFLAYLVPPSILFIPLAAIVFQLGLFDTRLGADPDLPDLPDPVLHLAADGLLPLHPLRARGMRADRRRHAAGRSSRASSCRWPCRA